MCLLVGVHIYVFVLTCGCQKSILSIIPQSTLVLFRDYYYYYCYYYLYIQMSWGIYMP